MIFPPHLHGNPAAGGRGLAGGIGVGESDRGRWAGREGAPVGAGGVGRNGSGARCRQVAMCKWSELMCCRHRCAYTQEARRELISTGSSSHTQGPMPGTSGSPLDATICISHPLSILPRGHPLPSPPRSPHAATKHLSPSASPRQPQLPTTTNLPASPSPRDAAAHGVPTSPPRATTRGQLPPSRVVHLGSGVANPQLSNLHAANPPCHTLSAPLPPPSSPYCSPVDAIGRAARSAASPAHRRETHTENSFSRTREFEGRCEPDA